MKCRTARSLFSARMAWREPSRRDAEARGLDVLDATCPLVTKVHVQGRQYVAQGRTLILIGHAGHPEVEGTIGQIPGTVVLVQSEAEVATLGLPVDTPSRTSRKPRCRSTTRAASSMRCNAASPISSAPIRATSATRRKTARPPCAS